MSQKKRKPDKKRFPERKLSSKQADLLSDAQSLMRTGRWQSAAEILAQLDREYPNRPEILETRLQVAEHFQDRHQAQDLCERLLLLRPRDPELHLFFAGVCMRNVRPAQ